MGQGTSKYRKITRTPQTGENAGKKLWYATAVSDREMSFEDFVTHISEHNSPYSRGTIHGVLMDILLNLLTGRTLGQKTIFRGTQLNASFFSILRVRIINEVSS